MTSAVRVAVVGYGNPLRRDDAVGLRAAEAAAARWGDRIIVLTGQQLVPEWAIPLGEADLVFLLDASTESGLHPRIRPLEAPPVEAIADGHTFGPRELLGLIELVYGRAPAAYLLTLPVSDLDFGEELSPLAREGLERGLRLLEGRLRVGGA